MSAKKWLLAFFLSLLIVLLSIVSLNTIVDPFGVFGDGFYNWYAFNYTENPKVAKVAWLDDNYQKFNAYIIGSSGSSAFSPAKLNDYTGLNFYNLFIYGADMYNTEKMVDYAVANYEVKHIVLNLGVVNAAVYNLPKDNETNYLHTNVEKDNKTLFYLKYLFANPGYAFYKIQSAMNDTYLQQGFDSFIAETGCYDKSIRDIERIGSLDDYLIERPVFSEPITKNPSLPHIEECIKSLSNIKELCDSKGIELTVIMPPIYAPEALNYNKEDIAKLWKRIAEVTDFWDFTYSSLSYDPRYFYDETHCRNIVGDMMLAKIFNDTSIYIPEDFGVYVNQRNAEEVAMGFANENYISKVEHEKKLPILMYHHFDEKGDGKSICSYKAFESHMKALSENGYTAVSFDELIAYVYQGKPLPEKPVMITFDDGYQSNYDFAYPILKKYNLKGTIFVIGVSVGKDTYKYTGEPMFAHFGEKEIRELSDSGVISIQSHSFDMHQSEKYDKDGFRAGVLQKADETELDYIKNLKNDFLKSKKQIELRTGKPAQVFAYPNGLYSNLSEVILKELGVKVTLSTDSGINTVVKGLPQTLQALKRYSISDRYTDADVIRLLED